MPSEKLQQPDGHRDVLNYDFCPWVNQYVYWLKKPIGWLFTAAATAAMLGIYVAPQAMVVSAAVLALIGLGMLWPAIAMKGIYGELTWQRQRTVEGEPIETILKVINHWPWPVWGISVESNTQVVNDGSGHSRSVALECLRPFSTTEFLWDSRPTQRGLYPDRASFLTTSFPFGIWSARAKLSLPRSLLVWPEALDLHDMPNLSGNHRSVVGAWIDKPGFDGDVIGVRPFRDGDSLRNVHWAQSAKSDNLIVCERQSVSRRSIHLTMDCLPDSRAIAKEWVIRIGASIAKTFLAHQWSVSLEISGQSIQAEPGEAGLRKLMDLLATFDSRPMKESELTPDNQAPNNNEFQIGQARSGKKLPRSLAPRNRRNPSANALQIVVTSGDRVELMNFASSGSSCVLVNDSHAHATPCTLDVSPWIEVDLANPVWQQVQSQWDRVCHANASMVATG